VTLATLTCTRSQALLNTSGALLRSEESTAVSSTYDAPPTPPGPQRGPTNNRTLIIALAAVSLIAIAAPVLVYFLTRSSDDTAQVDSGADPIVTPTPDPLNPAAVDTTDTNDGSVASGATENPAAVAPAPTPVPTTTSGAAAPPAAAAAPVVQELSSQSPSVYRITGITAGSSVNVRQSAGTANALIGTIPSNAVGIAGTGRRVLVDGSEWREIQFRDGTGWVFGGYLALAPVPVPTSAAAGAATATVATPVPTVVVQALGNETAGLYRVTGVSAGASVNVRVEPGSLQLLLGTLPGDTAAVPTTGRRTQVDGVEWRQIAFRDGTGWVDARFLELVTEPPTTVTLQAGSATTVGIVPMGSIVDRIVLRAEPGIDQASVGTVGSSVVNITATGRTAQVGTQRWSEITASGTTGWIQTQQTISNPRSAQQVLSSGGAAAVTIDQVVVGQDGRVSVVIGGQTVPTVANATVVSAAGGQQSIADWATAAGSSTGIRVEVNVASGNITRIWLT